LVLLVVELVVGEVEGGDFIWFSWIADIFTDSI